MAIPVTQLASAESAGPASWADLLTNQNFSRHQLPFEGLQHPEPSSRMLSVHPLPTMTV